MLKAISLLKNNNYIFCIGMLLVYPIFLQAQRKPSNIISPEVLPDNSVIFRLKAPNAKEAKIVGTWNRKFAPDIMIEKRLRF